VIALSRVIENIYYNVCVKGRDATFFFVYPLKTCLHYQGKMMIN